MAPGPDPDPIPLCHLDDLPDGGARGFDLPPQGTDGGTDGAMEGRNVGLSVIVVRRGRQLHGYVNACPHLGTPLEIFPDKFLTRDGRHLLCHTHGALFTPEQGYCVSGPCKGDHLPPVPLELCADGRVLAWPPDN